MYATHMAINENATIYLLHIVDIRGFDYNLPMYNDFTLVTKQVVDQVSEDQLMDKLRNIVPKEFKGKVETVISFGVPFAEIIKAAKDYDIDLIVMGTHGRGAVAHLIIGSVAERVVRKAPCPVLTVRKTGHKFIMP